MDEGNLCLLPGFERVDTSNVVILHLCFSFKSGGDNLSFCKRLKANLPVSQNKNVTC